MTQRDDAPDNAQLCGLVFELASQLHVERARRLALEAALVRAGLLPAGAIEALAGDAALRERTLEQLEASMAALVRLLTENPDPRRPLRDAAAEPGSKGG